MEAEKTSSFKRKPLSDCTNTVAAAHLKPSSLATKSAAGGTKPPKSSISVADAQIAKPPKSSISVAADQAKPPKSSISIAANQIAKPPKSSISVAAGIKTPKSSVSIAAAQITKPPKSSVSIAAAQTKPPKSSVSIAAAVTTTTAAAKKPDSATSSSYLKSLASTGSDVSSNAPNVLLNSPAPLAPLSDSDDRVHGRYGLPVSQSQRQDAKTRMDKGKMVVETPIIQISEPFTPPTLQLSSSAASGNCHLSRSHAIQSKNPDAEPQKDKGKMVLEASSIEASDPVTPLLVSSSSASDDRDHRRSGFPITQSRRQDAKTRMDKGEMALETPIIQISKPFTPPTLQLSSSGNSLLSGPHAIQSKNQDAQPQKDRGKMVLEASSTEASDPLTPRAALLVSSSSASGVQDQERADSLTVYSQRRSRRRRQHAVGKTIMPFSCPPRKRTKLKGVEFEGVEFEDADGDQQRGSLTAPLPLHKKKRSWNKKDEPMHGMPQDEIERLKSYYADIDAFELPEEVASESD